MRNNVKETNGETQESKIDSLGASVKIQKINNAILLGNNCPEFEELMSTPATLTVGEVYPGKRRGTRDDEWDPETRPWADWIVGDNDKWGLSVHAQTPGKDGPGTVFGACNTYRRARAVTSVAALALDLDTGHHAFDQVTELVEKLDRAAIIYTTHSHMAKRANLNFDDVVKHTKCDCDPASTDVQRYMREKKNIAPHICDGSEILEIDKEAKDGWQIIVKTPPTPKMRVVFPLKEAKKISDLGATQKAALDAYKETVLALGEMLGVVIDEACTDPSRFFYRPAHKKDAPHQTVIFQAPPLAWDEVKIDADPVLDQWQRRWELHRRETVQTRSAKTAPTRPVFMKTTASACYWRNSAKVTVWARLPMHRTAAGSFTPFCPYNHEHTDSADDAATFAVDADQSEHGYAVIKCMHASCAQRKTADFIAGYIDNGDLTVDDILDSGYLLPPDEDAGEKYNRLTPEEKKDAGLITLEKREQVTKAVAQLGDAPEQDAVDDLIARVSGTLAPVILEELAKQLKKASGLPIGEVRKMLKHLRSARASGDFPLIPVDDDYRAAREEALAIMVEQDPPSLFHNSGRMIEIAEDENENLAMKEVGKDVFKARMEARTGFHERRCGEGRAKWASKLRLPAAVDRLSATAPRDACARVRRGQDAGDDAGIPSEHGTFLPAQERR